MRKKGKDSVVGLQILIFNGAGLQILLNVRSKQILLNERSTIRLNERSTIRLNGCSTIRLNGCSKQILPNERSTILLNGCSAILPNERSKQSCSTSTQQSCPTKKRQPEGHRHNFPKREDTSLALVVNIRDSGLFRGLHHSVLLVWAGDSACREHCYT